SRHIMATMRTILLLLGVLGWADDVFGTWKVNSAHSTFVEDPHPRAVTVRIEWHAKGEVFTLDQIRGNGQAVTTSNLLPRRRGAGVPRRSMFRYPVLAPSGPADRGDSAHVRERGVDPVRPAIVRAGERTRPGDHRATSPRPPL